MLIYRVREKKEVKYEYASIQFKITNAGEFFPRLQSLIPDDALFHEYDENGRDKYGREDEPHVTVLYGLEENVSLTDIRQIVSVFGAMECLVGAGVTVFTDDRRYDVVKLDVVAPNLLWRLNDRLRILPVPGQTYRVFKPHMTLAYVLKGWKPPASLAGQYELQGYLELCRHGARTRI